MKIADRVQETTNTTGTGTINLDGASAGYQAFSAAFVTGDLVPYVITNDTDWEVGIGTLTTGTPWTLARTTIIKSSNAGSAISVSAGSKVFCDLNSVYIPNVGGKQTHAAAHTTTGNITITAKLIEVSTDGDGDADILALPAGFDGQELEIYIKSNGSVSDSLTVNATFADGSTSFAFGKNCKGRGMSLVYSTTSTAGWIITGMFNMGDNQVRNYSTASQAISNTTRTYLTGSQLKAPATGFKIGTILKWVIHVTKSAAGTASSTIDICFGTNGSTSDTARVSFTKPAGTAAADAGVVTITAIVRGPISASCIVAGVMDFSHNLAATGHLAIANAVVQTNSSAFDITTSGIGAGICWTAGSSDSLTFQLVSAEAVNI